MTTSEPVSRRLADLEARLASLEGESGPPASTASRLSRRLDALEAREHHHAQAVAHLEGRLAAMQSQRVQALEAAAEDDGGPPEPSASHSNVATFPPRPKRSLGRRALDGLNYLRYVWRRLQGHDGTFPDQSLKEVLGDDVQDVPSLGLVLLYQDSLEDATIQAALQGQTAGWLPYVTFDTATGRLGPASKGFWTEPPSADVADALRGADLAYLVTLPLEELLQWPSTLAESLQPSLAVEELDVLEVLLSPTLRVLVQRARHWHPLAQRSISPTRGKIGKIVHLASAPMAALLDGQFERRTGPYRFASAGTTLKRRRLAPAPADKHPDQHSTLILADDLLGGREQLFSDLFLRLAPTPWLLVGEADPLSRQRLAQLQRLRRLDGIDSRVYALGAMIPAPLRHGAVAWLARRWKAGKVMPLVPQESTVSAPDREPLSLAIASSLAESLEVHFPPVHGGAFLCHSAPEVDLSPGRLAMESLRRQLDWQDERPMVLWFGDLLPKRRPEDFLALAHRCRDQAAFLMVGRGPLEGSIDDLAGFLDLENFRRLPSLPLSFAIGSSHVVCSTAPQELLPYALLAALTSRRNILLPEGSELARRLVDLGAGWSYPLGDVEGAQQVLLQLLSKEDEDAAAASSRPESTPWPSPEQVDTAWRNCLDGS